MHPHTLHATIAAHNLAQARIRLDTLVARERADNIREQLPAASVLHSPSWSRLSATGGHGDPTPGAVDLLDEPIRTTWWADLARRADQRLAWIADQLAPGPGDPLNRIHRRIPALSARAAAVVAQHLRDEDAWLRQSVAVPVDAGLLLAGVECPACQGRQVHRVLLGDVLVCRAEGCRCAGEGCGCGMSALVVGLVHVWGAVPGGKRLPS